MYYMEHNEISYAFICPKKLGKPIVRNKIRRQLKESFLKNSTKIDSKMSIIFIAKENILESSFKKIDDMILLSLKKKKLINENI